MPVQHTNRKGQTYYLHQQTRKNGKITYYFSLKAPEKPVADMPSGFEVYESPNGLAFLRKIQTKVIADDEVTLVTQEIRRWGHLRRCRVDVRGNTIIVYTPDQNDGDLTRLFAAFGLRAADAANALTRSATYSAEMRFTLADREKRLFIAQRYCYSGSIDGWIDFAGPRPLKDLAKYVKHLGKESFFNLGPGC